MTNLFKRNGEAFEGRVVPSEKGKPGHNELARCGRCGGAGRSAKWAHTGWTCYDCGGSGNRGYEWHPLYTAEQLVKLDAAAAKREAKRQALAAERLAQRNAEADARRAAFLEQHAALIERAQPFAETDPTIADLLDRGGRFALLSERQVELLVSLCERHEEKARQAATSQHVGTIGERIELPVTVARVASFERPFYRSYSNALQTVWVVTMTDAAGNQIVSKTPRFQAEVGDTFTLRATVKAHDAYQGIKQTVVERVSAKGAKA